MEDHLPRKLAAILYADVAGYSRLTATDEDGTHRALTKSLDLIAEQVLVHRGRVGHYAGDAVLADFASVTDAVSCAIWIQRALQKCNEALPRETQLQFRIGLNLGEVIDDRGEVFGDGVNLAARLESMATPGGICASEAVRSAVADRLPLKFKDLGEWSVKNMPTPVHAWQVFDIDSESLDGTWFLLRAEVRAYGVLMGGDDRSTRDALDRARYVLTSEVERQGGCVLDTPGETLLSRFRDARHCIVCAQEAQNVIADLNANTTEQARVSYRYGIDVMNLDRDAGGGEEGAIARTARLCDSAPPNVVLVTDTAREYVGEDSQLTWSAVTSDTYVLEAASGAMAQRSSVPVQLEALALPLPEKPSIVLLPFEGIGEGSDVQDFAEGLRIDIQNALVKLSGLFLTAAGAANAFRGRDAVESAQALGVRHVLEGKVRRSGDRVRVNAQLIDTADSVVVWSEQYDRTSDDDFALQDEITECVIGALDVELASGEQSRIWRKCLSNKKARDLFYRGLNEFFQMNADSMAKAKRRFGRVAEAAPTSPLGPTWVAMSLWFEATRGWAPDADQARTEAGLWAEKAAVFEDADGQAQTVLGNVRLLQGRFDEALEIAKNAVAVRPGCTNSNGFLANVLLHCGEPQDALTHVKRAIRLSPVYPPWFLEILAASYREAGELGLAIVAAREVIRLAPQSVHARVILASALIRAGWDTEASRVASEILSLDEQFSTTAFRRQQVFREEAVVERLVSDLVEAGLRN